MILTMADVQHGEVETEDSQIRPRLHIHGGPRLLHSMACARRFVFRTGMPLTVHEAELQPPLECPTPSFVDENIQVWSLPIRRGDANTHSKSSTENVFDESADTSDAESMSEDTEPVTIEEQQNMRRSIVNDMFDSQWRRDRLVETAFKDVKMPATVYLRDPQTKELVAHNCLSRENAPHIQSDTIVLVRNPWPASLISDLPRVSHIPKKVAMSYIVKGHAQRGAFDPGKARELGVKPGPDYGKLTNGFSITLPDGAVILPEMVLGPTKQGRGIAIVDVPSTEYLDGALKALGNHKDAMEGIEAVCWLVHAALFDKVEFQTALHHFNHLKQFVATSDTLNYLAMGSSAASAIRLSQICPDIFPLPIYSNSTPDYQRQLASVALPDLHQIQRGLKIQIEPKFELQKEEIPAMLTTQAIKPLPREVESMLPAEPQRHEGVANPRESSGTAQTRNFDEPQIITLGTGSAVPSKYRNVSATLLQIPGLGSYLFDCGENTLGQLKRVLSPEQLKAFLLDLRMIWISHLHADHHLGTVSMIQEATKVQKRASGETFEPLFVMSEANMGDFLKDYNETETIPHRFVVCNPNTGPTYEGKRFDYEKHDLGVQNIKTVRVSHCHGAQAISVTFKNGFKFSYSGDCRPSARFTEIGKGSDVLVHEATFDDGMEGDAIAKKHSTTAEAMGVALQMGAKNVILTHFSQRYQKIPVLSNVKLPGQMRFEEGNNAEDAAAGPVDEAVDAESAEPHPEAGEPLITLDKSTMMSIVSDSVNMSDDSTSAAGGEHQDFLDKVSAPIVPRKGNVLARRRLSAEQHAAWLKKVREEMNVCVAFDYMKIKVSQIKEMKNYYPAIERMFELDQERSDTKRGEAKNSQQSNEQINRGRSKKESNQDGTGGKQVSGKDRMPSKKQQSREKREREGASSEHHSDKTVTERDTERRQGDDVSREDEQNPGDGGSLTWKKVRLSSDEDENGPDDNGDKMTS